jgi:hypothetical protein
MATEAERANLSCWMACVAWSNTYLGPAPGAPPAAVNPTPLPALRVLVSPSPRRNQKRPTE